MPGPDNGIYIIQAEVNLVVTAMRRNTRWNSHHQSIRQDQDDDPLINEFCLLKDSLNNISSLDDISPTEYLSPFLNVIRSEDTTGPITGIALNSVNKVLSYHLFDENHESTNIAVENMAEAVTHARFVGTDPGSDEVVLMKILMVLKSLMLSSVGKLLTNESICEIMQSCFRICFEMRLSELLRKIAEHTLIDMVRLIFTRLPDFKEDSKSSSKRLKMRTGGMENRNRKVNKRIVNLKSRDNLKKITQPSRLLENDKQINIINSVEKSTVDETLNPTNSLINDNKVIEISDGDLTSQVIKPDNVIVEDQEKISTVPDDDLSEAGMDIITPAEMDTIPAVVGMPGDLSNSTDKVLHATESEILNEDDDYVNAQGVRFTQSQTSVGESRILIPYGLPSIRELFRFLISLTSPIDRHNTDIMVHMGLNLLTVALESGADHMHKSASLMALIKDDMLRNALFLLSSERLSLFAMSLRVCFLLFEAMRGELKLQMEMFIEKLMDIIVSDSLKIVEEKREIALEALVQLCRIPGLVTELYLNYDCHLYCSNLFEDLMKLLSKNAFPVSGLFTTHLLSLDCLLAVIDNIEEHCHHRSLHCTETSEETYSSFKEDTAKKIKPATIKPNRMLHCWKNKKQLPTEHELLDIKRKKKIYQTGTEYFNTKPGKGIEYLKEQGYFKTPLDPDEVVKFLRENPKLDKKMIGEYISNKKNEKILPAFQKSFEFENVRIDEALRVYLETFRLPGEAPVIQFLLEHFAQHWHEKNGEPFANTDAAFTLAYAIIMLNTDQHNHNVRKQSVPMNIDQFKRNVAGVNGGNDFDNEMLEDIFENIRSDEIIMPSEQSGIVKENYLWNVGLRRGNTSDGEFLYAPTGAFDKQLFAIVWGPTVAALSFVFDKSLHDTVIQKSIAGFRKCAQISAHYGLSDVFDNLVISLCKFTGLMSGGMGENGQQIAVNLGNNRKAQLSLKTLLSLAKRHADMLRDGWRNLLDCILQLYQADLLPEILTIVEDFVEPSGRISLITERRQRCHAAALYNGGVSGGHSTSTLSKTDSSGVFSIFFNTFSLSDAQTYRQTPEEIESIKRAKNVLEECHIEQIITDSKFLRADSLFELVKALALAVRPDLQQQQQPTPADESNSVFLLEMLIRVVLNNRDRVSPLWGLVKDLMYSVLVATPTNSSNWLIERTVIGLIRLALWLLRRDDIATHVLATLKLLLLMKPNVLQQVSRHIAYGFYELLRTNAAHIHDSDDWKTLLTVMEVVGAGLSIPPILQVNCGVDVEKYVSDAGCQSDPETSNASSVANRGYTSDSEVTLINSGNLPIYNHYSVCLDVELRGLIDQNCLNKVCDALAFLIRDAAYITELNFDACLHSVRTLVEATVTGGKKLSNSISCNFNSKKSNERIKPNKKSHKKIKNEKEFSDDEQKKIIADETGHKIAMQLLDLLDTLHTRAGSIFSKLTQQDKIDLNSLWVKCWCPCLQGMARLCCDSRRMVRQQSLTYLQRALVMPDLQNLTAYEWELCFNKVLFPLLTALLQTSPAIDPNSIDETRVRASALLSKVFLQHLTPLRSLSTFTALWLTILDFMHRFMHADNSDLLSDAVPESLKNMLLVMKTTAGMLNDQGEDDNRLWRLTWDRIDSFLPNLKNDLFSKPRVHNSPLSSPRSQSPQRNEEDDRLPSPTVILQPPLPNISNSSTNTPIILHPPQDVTPSKVEEMRLEDCSNKQTASNN